jgi:hypothetical protein
MTFAPCLEKFHVRTSFTIDVIRGTSQVACCGRTRQKQEVNGKGASKDHDARYKSFVVQKPQPKIVTSGAVVFRGVGAQDISCLRVSDAVRCHVLVEWVVDEESGFEGQTRRRFVPLQPKDSGRWQAASFCFCFFSTDQKLRHHPLVLHDASSTYKIK